MAKIMPRVPVGRRGRGRRRSCSSSRPGCRPARAGSRASPGAQLRRCPDHGDAAQGLVDEAEARARCSLAARGFLTTAAHTDEAERREQVAERVDRERAAPRRAAGRASRRARMPAFRRCCPPPRAGHCAPTAARAPRSARPRPSAPARRRRRGAPLSAAATASSEIESEFAHASAARPPSSAARALSVAIITARLGQRSTRVPSSKAPAAPAAHIGDEEQRHLQRCRSQRQRGEPGQRQPAQHRAEIGDALAGQDAAEVVRRRAARRPQGAWTASRQLKPPASHGAPTPAPSGQTTGSTACATGGVVSGGRGRDRAGIERASGRSKVCAATLRCVAFVPAVPEQADLDRRQRDREAPQRQASARPEAGTKLSGSTVSRSDSCTTAPRSRTG